MLTDFNRPRGSNGEYARVQLSSVADLRTFKPWYEGQVISVKGYYNGSNLGGGEFVARAINKVDDGIIFFNGTNGVYYWERILVNNTINIFACGLKADGATVETTLLQAALTKLKAATSANQTMPTLDGENNVVVVDSTVSIDVRFVNLENIKIIAPNMSATTYTPILKVITTSITSVPANYRKHGSWAALKDVHIFGPVLRSNDSSLANLITGVEIAPNADGAAGLTFDNLVVQQCVVGIVLRSNAYLITFNNIGLYNNNICVADSSYIGLDASISNMGENIRFFGGAMANSNQHIGLKYDISLYFHSTSFDYTGGAVGKSYIINDIVGGAPVLCYDACHFEGGNANDGPKTYYFYCAGKANISITGGYILFNNTTYNTIPYWFYDASSTGARCHFSIEGTYLFGLGVKRWSNIQPRKFFPKINIGVSQVRNLISDKTRLLLDPTFSQATVLDQWWIYGGTRTDALTSEVMKGVIGTTTDTSGTTIPALKFTKTGTVNSTINLLIPRERNAFINTVEIALKFSAASGTGTLYATTKLVTPSRTFDAATLIPTSFVLQSTTLYTQNITMATGDLTTYTLAGSLDFGGDNEKYSHVLLTLNYGAAGNNTVLDIASVNVHQPF